MKLQYLLLALPERLDAFLLHPEAGYLILLGQPQVHHIQNARLVSAFSFLCHKYSEICYMKKVSTAETIKTVW